MTLDAVLKKLYALENKEKVQLKENRFAVKSSNALGIYHRDLKVIAKEIGKNSSLAMELFDTDIYEAKILCSQIFDINDLTNSLMEKWITSFENWEICDSFCMGLIAKSEYAVPKINEWVFREKEFEKRAGFTTMAAYCMADKKANNETFESFFPLIKSAIYDERLYVKKAVNWALRNIGKRNIDLHHQAYKMAEELSFLEHKGAKWIGKNALTEFKKPTINILDYPRAIYRPNN